MLEAIAVAAEVRSSAVRRASMLCGATIPVAVAALTEGESGLARFRLEVGRPLRPMLASIAPDVAGAFTKAAPEGETVAVDCKLDGIRIQVHKYDGRVAVFTRTLDEITDRVPEVLEAVAELPAKSLVLDGEEIALNEKGRARPFQETAARTASKVDVAALRETVPLTQFVTGRGPVLVDWPMSWTVPCIRDVPRVTDGLAQAPRVLLAIQPAHAWVAAIAYDPGQGGSFAGTVVTATSREVPSRLVGSPGEEWGRVVLLDYGVSRDAYERQTTQIWRWGWEGDT